MTLEDFETFTKIENRLNNLALNYLSMITSGGLAEVNKSLKGVELKRVYPDSAKFVAVAKWWEDSYEFDVPMEFFLKGDRVDPTQKS